MWPAVVMLVLLAAATLALIYHYGDRRRIGPAVLLIAFVGWYFPFSVVFVVPLDVLSVRTPTHLSRVSVCPSLSLSVCVSVSEGACVHALPCLCLPWRCGHPSLCLSLSLTHAHTHAHTHTHTHAHVFIWAWWVARQTAYNACNVTVETCERPIAYVGTDFLTIIWQVNYWTSFMLTWYEAADAGRTPTGTLPHTHTHTHSHTEAQTGMHRHA
jgi:hypothetical protein